MKIAEKFTELYDNDWTDSMEALEDLKISLIIIYSSPDKFSQMHSISRKTIY